ncbi:hypothetical protein EYF80_041526 [Liparis tanakae]|uniref:Uncharacterized protein n=1 Tax=Liparis tanakae TaxID=230148 RepID=A0A4Z2G3V8_9TELE|nr:hypothetical protein EYF80_041526 [Liparis tanakae]
MSEGRRPGRRFLSRSFPGPLLRSSSLVVRDRRDGVRSLSAVEETPPASAGAPNKIQDVSEKKQTEKRQNERKDDRSADHVLLLSKNRTRNRCSRASWVICSPSFSTSSGGTGIGTPRWNTPSLGILGSMIWKRRSHTFRHRLAEAARSVPLCGVVSHQSRVGGVASALGPHQVQSYERRTGVKTAPGSPTPRPPDPRRRHAFLRV